MRRNIKFGLTFAIFALCFLGYSLFQFERTNSYNTEFNLEIHVEMWHYRNNILLSYSHHPGTLTNLGANWIEDQLGDSPGADPAKWIALSNDAASPDPAWTTIPNEITTGDMARAAGTYADDGTGQWNITKSFSPSETGSCRLTGLYWASTGDYLLCADTFTVINYEDGDTVTIKWSISVS